MVEIQLDKNCAMAKVEQRILRNFNKGCVEYGLLQDGDRILIALSGGKDSLELLRLLAQRARIFRPHITVEAAHVIMDDIPYETDRTYLEDFCRENGVTLHILHSSTRAPETQQGNTKGKCFYCSRSRRRTLFNFAVENNFNKVALGHHNDDIITTFLMNITFEGSTQTMPPSLQMEHYPITIIRPLCLVHEDDIREHAQQLGFHKQKTPCPYEEQTNRATMNHIFHQLQEINPEARYSLWKALSKKPPPSPPIGGVTNGDIIVITDIKKYVEPRIVIPYPQNTLSTK